MRVAYLTSRFPDRYHTFVRREINALASQGVDVTVFPLIDARQPLDRNREADCSVAASVAYAPFCSGADLRAAGSFLRRRPGPLFGMLKTLCAGTFTSPVNLAKSLAILPRSLGIARRLGEERFDHIHAHWATHPATAALIASELTGIPFSFAFHAYDIFATRILIPQKIRSAAFAVVNCRYTLDYLRRLYPEVDERKLLLLYNGMDWSEFRTPASPPAGAPPLLMAVGSLIPTKGFVDFVNACRLLAESHVAFKGVIIGSGPQRQRLQQLIDAGGLAGTVELLGERSQREVREYMAVASALVMPCVTPDRGSHDALPNVIIEAQAAGLPVVATPVFGIPEIVEHEVTGLLVPERDPCALKTALARVLADPAWSRGLALAARERIRGRFDIHVNARQLLDRFESSVAAAGSGRGRAGMGAGA